jgi:hypothetical protein
MHAHAYPVAAHLLRLFDAVAVDLLLQLGGRVRFASRGARLTREAALSLERFCGCCERGSRLEESVTTLVLGRDHVRCARRDVVLLRT